MSIIGSNALAGASGQSTGGGGGGGGATTQIDRSLRFVSADSAYLSRTPTSAGNRKTWTWSAWIKRATIGTSQRIFTGATSAADADWTAIHFVSDKLFISGYNTHYRYSNRLFRDPGAWFHLVVKYDLDASTEAEKIKAWYNGEVITWESSTAAPATSGINAANNHTLGAEQAPNNGGLNSYCDLYLAEVHFVDGQALAASDFGEYDSNNVWQPKEYAGGFADWFDNSRTWSSDVTGTAYSSAYAATNGFDGSLSTRAGGDFTFTPPSPIACTKVKIYMVTYANDGSGNTPTGKVFLNGVDIASQIPVTSQYAVPLEFTPSNNQFASYQCTGDGNEPGWFSRIELLIDGVWTALLDSSVSVANNGFHLNFSDNSSDAALGTDSSGNSNDWTVNNLSADGPGVTTTGNISLNSTNRSFYFKGTSGQSIGVSSGNHVWDSSDGISWTYRGTSSTSVSLTAAYIYISGTTDITFTNSSSASVKYWDLALGTGIANASGTTATFNLEAYGAEGIDSLIDTPTNYTAASGNNGGNYATMNPLNRGSTQVALSNGNLDVSVGTNASTGTKCQSTIGMSSGKYYCEFTCVSGSHVPGLASTATNPYGYFLGDDAGSWSYGANGKKYHNDPSASGASYGATWGAGDVIGVAFDADNGTLTFYKNGSSQGTAYTGLTSGPYFFATGGSNSSYKANFGQRPFAYTPPTGYVSLCTTNLADPTIADGSTAFDVALWTGNGSTAQTISTPNLSPDMVWVKERSSTSSHAIIDAVRGSTNAAKVIYPDRTDDEVTANSTQSITSLNSDGFTIGSSDNSVNENGQTYVGWTWDAGTSSTSISAGGTFNSQSQVWSTYGTFTGTHSGDYDWVGVFNNSMDYDATGSLYLTTAPGKWTLTSSIACYSGVKFYLYGNTSITINDGLSDEVTQTSTGGSSFHYFTISFSGNISSIQINTTDTYLMRIYVDGAALVDSGITVTNGDPTTASIPPSIASTVRANPSAGFSIVSFTGTGSTETVGHGLNATPELIILKDRDNTYDWVVYTQQIDGSWDFLKLNLTNTKSDSSYSAATSSVFTYGTDAADYVAYCFTSVEGYSKISTYTANALDNGPFVYTGFRPKWIMLKHASGTAISYSSWLIVDTERDTYNVSDASLLANMSAIEGTRGDGTGTAGPWVDILSNGFKVRYSWQVVNGTSGDKYLYMAFAENPFSLNGGLAR